MDIKDLQQLSKGNIVWENYGGLYEVETIGTDFLLLAKPGARSGVTGRYDVREVNFIALEDKWLSRFGFVHEPWGWFKDGSVLLRSNLAGKYYVEMGNGLRINLPYVHSLQNLIRLTGVELKIR